MIETIAVARMLRETVATPYPDLVTRPTGVAVRGRIEALLATSEWDTAPARLLGRGVARLQLRRRGRRQAAAPGAGTHGTSRRAARAARAFPRVDSTPCWSTSSCSWPCCRTAGTVLLGDVPDDVRLVFEELDTMAPCGGPDPVGTARLDDRPHRRRPRKLPAPGGSRASAGYRLRARAAGMTRRLGLSTIAIHGVPHRRPDWSPVVPPLMQSSTFTNPVGSDRGGALHPVRQQPEPGRHREEVRAARGRGSGAVPRERHGRHRARAPGDAASRRSSRVAVRGSMAARASCSTRSSAGSGSR